MWTWIVKIALWAVSGLLASKIMNSPKWNGWIQNILLGFVGGIRGLSELERRADTDMKVAFSMYPTSMEELFRVADQGRLMPPKSTWFEPKLRSGLLIHEFER